MYGKEEIWITRATKEDITVMEVYARLLPSEEVNGYALHKAAIALCKAQKLKAALHWIGPSRGEIIQENTLVYAVTTADDVLIFTDGADTRINIKEMITDFAVTAS